MEKSFPVKQLLLIFKTNKHLINLYYLLTPFPWALLRHQLSSKAKWRRCRFSGLTKIIAVKSGNGVGTASCVDTDM